jgi:hypothetical protein
MGCTWGDGEEEVRSVADARVDDGDDTTWTGRKRGSSGSTEAGSSRRDVELDVPSFQLHQ